jgi:hypothetical protein
MDSAPAEPNNEHSANNMVTRSCQPVRLWLLSPVFSSHNDTANICHKPSINGCSGVTTRQSANRSLLLARGANREYRTAGRPTSSPAH